MNYYNKYLKYKKKYIDLFNYLHGGVEKRKFDQNYIDDTNNNNQLETKKQKIDDIIEKYVKYNDELKKTLDKFDENKIDNFINFINKIILFDKNIVENSKYTYKDKKDNKDKEYNYYLFKKKLNGYYKNYIGNINKPFFNILLNFINKKKDSLIDYDIIKFQFKNTKDENNVISLLNIINNLYDNDFYYNNDKILEIFNLIYNKKVFIENITKEIIKKIIYYLEEKKENFYKYFNIIYSIFYYKLDSFNKDVNLIEKIMKILDNFFTYSINNKKLSFVYDDIENTDDLYFKKIFIEIFKNKNIDKKYKIKIVSILNNNYQYLFVKKIFDEIDIDVLNILFKNIDKNRIFEFYYANRTNFNDSTKITEKEEFNIDFFSDYYDENKNKNKILYKIIKDNFLKKNDFFINKIKDYIFNIIKGERKSYKLLFNNRYIIENCYINDDVINKTNINEVYYVKGEEGSESFFRKGSEPFIKQIYDKSFDFIKNNLSHENIKDIFNKNKKIIIIDGKNVLFDLHESSNDSNAVSKYRILFNNIKEFSNDYIYLIFLTKEVNSGSEFIKYTINGNEIYFITITCEKIKPILDNNEYECMTIFQKSEIDDYLSIIFYNIFKIIGINDIFYITNDYLRWNSDSTFVKYYLRKNYINDKNVLIPVRQDRNIINNILGIKLLKEHEHDPNKKIFRNTILGKLYTKFNGYIFIEI